ncbi:MAG: DUF349 domain-containing protein [Gammaproteobacteria bacterium]
MTERHSARPTPPADAAPLDDAALGRAVRRLLANKKGIDESKAKRLRKQWEARAGDAESPAPSSAPSSAQAGESLSALFAKLRARIHKQVERRDRQFAEAEENLQHLQASVEKGDVTQSQKLEQSLRNALATIPGLSQQRRQKIAGGLEALQEELQQLASWRKWGTLQAREKIIAEMRGIHQSGADLQEIAQRIRRAREQWRDWDRGGEGGHSKLYEQFDLACSEAYQPCQAHFDAQHREREKNTQRRDEICAQLEEEFEKIEWRNPDWKTLRAWLGARREDWRKAGPAAYQSRKPLQRRFEAVMEKFEEPLERERRRNYKMREKLTSEAEALAEREDAGAAFSEFQRIKRAWVSSVSSARKRERALWKRFSAAGERVLEKRKLGVKDFKKTLRDNLETRAALCAEIEASCKGDARAGIRAHLKAWQARWEQLGEAPKADKEKIQARFHNALERAQQAMAQSEQSAQRDLHDLLRQKAAVCAQLEALALGGKPGKRAVEKLSAEWAKVAELPAEFESDFGARYALATEALQEDDARLRLQESLPANLAQLHALLLRLEILGELESPPEFAKQRMALQIERLSLAMGKGGAAGDGAKTAERLMCEILVSGAVEEAARAAAMTRFDACCAALRASAQKVNKTSSASKSSRPKTSAS